GYCHDNNWFDSWDILAIKSQYGRRRNWQVFGDFDGDGKADLVTWTPGTGTWHTKRQSPYDPVNLPDRQWGGQRDGIINVPVIGDYDGDGLTDMAVWSASDGGWAIHSSRTWDQGLTAPPRGGPTPGRSLPTYLWGIPGDIPVPGDYDGDGKFDLATV